MVRVVRCERLSRGTNKSLLSLPSQPRLWTNIFIIMLLVLCLSEVRSRVFLGSWVGFVLVGCWKRPDTHISAQDKPVQAEVLMYLYVFSILNDFLNLVISQSSALVP